MTTLNTFKRSYGVLDLKESSDLYEEPIASGLAVDGKIIWSNATAIPPRSMEWNSGGNGTVTADTAPTTTHCSVNMHVTDLAPTDSLASIGAGVPAQFLVQPPFPASAYYAATTITGFAGNVLTFAALPYPPVTGSTFVCQGYLQPARFHLTVTALPPDPVYTDASQAVRVRRNIVLTAIPASTDYDDTGALQRITFADFGNVPSALANCIWPTYDLTATGLSPYSYRYYAEFVPTGVPPQIGNPANTPLDISVGGQILDTVSGTLQFTDVPELHSYLGITLTAANAIVINVYQYVGPTGTVSKSYVDQATSGKRYALAARVATAAALPQVATAGQDGLWYYNGSSSDGTGATLTARATGANRLALGTAATDGISLSVGDRILVTAAGIPFSGVTVYASGSSAPGGTTSTGALANPEIAAGVYQVMSLGSAGSLNWWLERVADLAGPSAPATGEYYDGTTVPIQAGQLYAGAQFTVAYVAARGTATPLVLGTDPLVWTETTPPIAAGEVGTPTDGTLGITPAAWGYIQDVAGITTSALAADGFDALATAIDRVAVRAYGVLPTWTDYIAGNAAKAVAAFGSTSANSWWLAQAAAAAAYAVATPLQFGHVAAPTAATGGMWIAFGTTPYIGTGTSAAGTAFAAEAAPSIGPVARTAGNTVTFAFRNTATANPPQTAMYVADGAVVANNIATFPAAGGYQGPLGSTSVRVAESGYGGNAALGPTANANPSAVRTIAFDVNASAVAPANRLAFPEVAAGLEAVMISAVPAGPTPNENWHETTFAYAAAPGAPYASVMYQRFFTAATAARVTTGSAAPAIASLAITAESLPATAAMYVSGVPRATTGDRSCRYSRCRT